MNKKNIFIIFLLILVSCNLKKEVVKKTSLNVKSAKELIGKIEDNNKIPEWISIKSKIKLNKDEQTMNLFSSIRIRKDSAIWMSIKAPLGIELFRILITNDSVYYMNITESTYENKAISYLSQQFKIDINYKQIQELLLGVPSIPNQKYNLIDNNTNYLLSNDKNKNNKVLFFVEKEDYRISKGKYFIAKKESFNFELTDYTKIEPNFIFPKKLIIDVNTNDIFFAEFNHTKIIVNIPQQIIFSVPSNYVKIN